MTSTTINPSITSVQQALAAKFPEVAGRASKEVWHNDGSRALVVRDGLAGHKGSLAFLALPLKGDENFNSFGIGFEDMTANVVDYFVVPPTASVKTVVKTFADMVASHTGDPIKRGAAKKPMTKAEARAKKSLDKKGSKTAPATGMFKVDGNDKPLTKDAAKAECLANAQHYGSKGWTYKWSGYTLHAFNSKGVEQFYMEITKA